MCYNGCHFLKGLEKEKIIKTNSTNQHEKRVLEATN